MGKKVNNSMKLSKIILGTGYLYTHQFNNLSFGFLFVFFLFIHLSIDGFHTNHTQKTMVFSNMESTQLE